MFIYIYIYICICVCVCVCVCVISPTRATCFFSPPYFHQTIWQSSFAALTHWAHIAVLSSTIKPTHLVQYRGFCQLLRTVFLLTSRIRVLVLSRLVSSSPASFFTPKRTQSISRLRLNDPLSTNNEHNLYFQSIETPHNGTKHT
jgi:hypothetical protein